MNDARETVSATCGRSQADSRCICYAMWVVERVEERVGQVELMAGCAMRLATELNTTPPHVKPPLVQISTHRLEP
jgi:hypothetical protein